MQGSVISTKPDLTGKVAVVTGAGRGLGRVFAKELAAVGAMVVFATRSVEQLASTLECITQAGGQAVAIPTDVTDPASVKDMMATVVDQFGTVDVLINNAAVTTPLGPVWEVSAEEWWKCLDVNVRRAFLCCQAVLPGMMARQSGRIINVGSTAGLRPMPGNSAYCTSKTALIRFSETLATEVKSHGIQVFTIHPGFVRTEMTEYLAASSEGKKWIPMVNEILSQGLDVSPALAAELVLLLTSGAGDELSGCFLNAMDNMEKLVMRLAEIKQSNLYRLRLQELQE